MQRRLSRWVHRRSRRRNDDRGFILVMMALLMVTLLIFAAFVIDIGALYSRTNKLQAAADAAALAAVVNMPDLTQATAAATAAVEANGLRIGGDLTLSVSPVSGAPRQVQVVLRDRMQPFFGKVVVDSFSMRREAKAQYSPSIPVGSPINVLGGPGENFSLAINGSCTAKEDGDRYLSMFEQNRHNSWAEGPPITGGPYRYSCFHPAMDVLGTGGIPLLRNTEYNNAGFKNPNPLPLQVGGYNYIIHVPCTVPIPDPTVPCPSGDVLLDDVHIEVYDWAFNPGQTGSDDIQPNNFCFNEPYNLAVGGWVVSGSGFVFDPAAVDAGGKCGMSTTFNLFRPDATPTNYADDVRVGQQMAVTSGAGAGRRCWNGDAATAIFACPAPGTWSRLFTIPSGSRRGNYRLQVRNSDNEGFRTSVLSYESYGSNSFALRAWRSTSGSFSRCMPPTPCEVSVAGDGTMSLFAKSDQPSADLYLARLSPASEFRGRQVVIQLWDPGEGGQTIQILEPGSTSGYPAQASLAPPGLLGISTDSNWTDTIGSAGLDVSGNTPLPAPFNVGQNYRGGQGKFNGRLVNLLITVASNYGLDAGGNEVPLADDGWWKIRYNFSASVRDRTTWTVLRLGTPIRLIP